MRGHVAAVFVHGNLEMSAVWDLLHAELERHDVVRLSPPGLGAPMPPGRPPLPARFDATMEDYRDWLIERLEAFREPVDLAGHDWGGAHVLNVAMARPDLLHSWVSDAAGLFETGYVWHPLPETWHTAAGGEQQIASMIGAPLTMTAAGRGLARAAERPGLVVVASDDHMTGTTEMGSAPAPPSPPSRTSATGGWCRTQARPPRC